MKKKVTIMPGLNGALAMLKKGYHFVFVIIESKVCIIAKSKVMPEMQRYGWQSSFTNLLVREEDSERYTILYHPRTETVDQAVEKLKILFKIKLKEFLAIKEVEMGNQVATTLQDYHLVVIDRSTSCPFGTSYYVVFGQVEEAQKLESHLEEDVIERYDYYGVSGYKLYGKWNKVCLKLEQIFGREIKLLV